MTSDTTPSGHGSKTSRNGPADTWSMTRCKSVASRPLVGGMATDRLDRPANTNVRGYLEHLRPFVLAVNSHNLDHRGEAHDLVAIKFSGTPSDFLLHRLS